MNTLIVENQIIVDRKRLSDIFKSGFKNTQKLGVEYEKIPIKNSDFNAVEFFSQNGILDFS